MGNLNNFLDFPTSQGIWEIQFGMSGEHIKFIQDKLGIKAEALAAAMEKAKKDSALLHNVIDSMQIADSQKILEVFASLYGVKHIRLDDLQISPEIVKLVPKKTAEDFKIIAIDKAGNNLIVAMTNPKDVNASEQIRFQTGYFVKPVFALESDIKVALQKHYSSARIEIARGKEEDGTSDALSDRIAISDRQKSDDPVVNLVYETLIQCISRRASDIHVETYEEAMRIRLRIDGVLHELATPPKTYREKICAKIKVMAKLKIDETRLPQDGNIQISYNQRDIDFRVSSLPCQFGEKIVMRILDKSNLEVDLKKLGFEQEQLNVFMENIKRPHGMVLVTGPTGSGKTTTLYSALQELNDDETNIMTAEDPVEYPLHGVNQVQMKPMIGLNFATALRAFLRQDPDVILVGEIRDFETAEISMKAALTGHMVLSTLHTNSAIDTISRLINMGLETFNLIAALNCVVAQRLMRKICDKCREVDPESTPEKLILIGAHPTWANQYKVYRGAGCAHCNQTGLKGRVAIHEVLAMNDELKKAIIDKASPMEIKEIAVRSGFITLRQSAIIKSLRGVSPISEIVRVTDSDSHGKKPQNIAS